MSITGTPPASTTSFNPQPAYPTDYCLDNYGFLGFCDGYFYWYYYITYYFSDVIIDTSANTPAGTYGLTVTGRALYEGWQVSASNTLSVYDASPPPPGSGAPTITSLSSNSGQAGDQLTATGTNLGNTTAVRFNTQVSTGQNVSQEAAFEAFADTRLDITFPPGVSGPSTVTVSNPNGSTSFPVEVQPVGPAPKQEQYQLRLVQNVLNNPRSFIGPLDKLYPVQSPLELAAELVRTTTSGNLSPVVALGAVAPPTHLYANIRSVVAEAGPARAFDGTVKNPDVGFYTTPYPSPLSLVLYREVKTVKSINGIENQVSTAANQIYSAPYKDIVIQVPESVTKQQILAELGKIRPGGQRTVDYLQSKYGGVFAVFVNSYGVVVTSGYVLDLARSGRNKP